MIKIIDGRGTGKSSRLLLLAKENNGVIVCENPRQMSEKAYRYGIVGIDYVSYAEYWGYSAVNSDTMEILNSKNVYIDDLSKFLNFYDANISGYCESSEDE